VTLREQVRYRGTLQYTRLQLQSVTQLDTMVKSTMTETVLSSGRGGTAAATMAQNEQMTEEHSTLEQQSPGRLDHPAYQLVVCCLCV